MVIRFNLATIVQVRRCSCQSKYGCSELLTMHDYCSDLRPLSCNRNQRSLLFQGLWRRWRSWWRLNVQWWLCFSPRHNSFWCHCTHWCTLVSRCPSCSGMEPNPMNIDSMAFGCEHKWMAFYSPCLPVLLSFLLILWSLWSHLFLQECLTCLFRSFALRMHFWLFRFPCRWRW